jgi:hypothetical protein
VFTELRFRRDFDLRLQPILLVLRRRLQLRHGEARRVKEQFPGISEAVPLEFHFDLTAALSASRMHVGQPRRAGESYAG